MSTLATGTPNRSETNCASVVSCPWPWLCVPVSTVTEAALVVVPRAGHALLPEQPEATARALIDFAQS